MTSTHNFCVHATPINKTHQLHSSLFPLRLSAGAYTISPQPSVSKYSCESSPWKKNKNNKQNETALHYTFKKNQNCKRLTEEEKKKPPNKQTIYTTKHDDSPCHYHPLVPRVGQCSCFCHKPKNITASSHA